MLIVKPLLLPTDETSLVSKQFDFAVIGKMISSKFYRNISDQSNIAQTIDKSTFHRFKGQVIKTARESMHTTMQVVRSCRVLVVNVDASVYWGEYDALMLAAVAAGTLVLTNGETPHRLRHIV